jgi:hypothetical protein
MLSFVANASFLRFPARVPRLSPAAVASAFVLAWALLAPALADGPLKVEDGVLTRDGRPYAAIGINYYDAFMCVLEERAGAVEDYRRGFAHLAEARIPFARFAACGFRPVNWKAWLERPEPYFAELDAIVAEAEKHGIGLIPSLFWSYFALPDALGEPASAWGDPKSRTRAEMRRYTREILARYKDSPAIWAWEFGNEFLNEADLPGPVQEDKWIVDGWGTPEKRAEADRLTSAALKSAYKEFAELVRSLDPVRPIMTGDAAPRVSAWNLARGKGWVRDNRDQWIEALISANPPPVDTTSLHLYHPRKEGKGYSGYGVEGQSLADNLRTAMEAATQSRRPLWLGEFGPGGGENDEGERRKQVSEFLECIVELRIPLSAYWVYQTPNHELSVWSAGPEGPNSFVFPMIAEANRRLQEAVAAQ